MTVLIIGAGAAGLATAIFAARGAPGLDIRCLDGARTIGAKILVSGGSRCNVTNRVVTEHDFWGGPSRTVRNVLRAFPADRAAAFFESLGVRLHEEEDGKLFPDTNRSRTVLDALLAEAARLGVVVETSHRVTDVGRERDGFRVGSTNQRRAAAEESPRRARSLAPTETSTDRAADPARAEAPSGSRYHARLVVLATGGQSLPKTGSDGFGYELAQRLGHSLVETTPALAPLVLEGDRHLRLAGVAHDVALTLRVDRRDSTRLVGALLWTHFGVSGPAALNMSRHWHRARLAGVPVELLLNLCPGETFESLEHWWLDQERERPRARAATVLATRLPASVADEWATSIGIDPETTMAHVTKGDRRRLLHSLLETVLPVRDSRGYAYAEVTAGGVPLDEIDAATMQSRVCPGLYLVGEILDVDGRLGGFNFQWAWSSGWVAGQAIAKWSTS